MRLILLKTHSFFLSPQVFCHWPLVSTFFKENQVLETRLTDPPLGARVLLQHGGVGQRDAPAGAAALARVERPRLSPEDRVRRLHGEVGLEVLRVQRGRHSHIAVVVIEWSNGCVPGCVIPT